jgi:RNA polymerase-binding transcription factor DksA
MTVFIPNTDVLDDAEVASLLEERERNSSIQAVLRDKPSNTRNIEDLLDPDKECDDCGAIISIERQRVILTIAHTCNYCVNCQELISKEQKLYARA